MRLRGQVVCGVQRNRAATAATRRLPSLCHRGSTGSGNSTGTPSPFHEADVASDQADSVVPVAVEVVLRRDHFPGDSLEDSDAFGNGRVEVAVRRRLSRQSGMVVAGSQMPTTSPSSA